MKNKLKKIIPLFIIGLLGIGIFLPTPTFAADPCASNLPDEIRAANGCNNTDVTSEDALPNTIRNILSGIIAAIGLLTVIYVIFGGYQYITSAGDPQKTQKAKTTILYALIGLAVCVLSYAIVNFTVNGIIKNQSSSSQTAP